MNLVGLQNLGIFNGGYSKKIVLSLFQITTKYEWVHKNFLNHNIETYFGGPGAFKMGFDVLFKN